MNKRQQQIANNLLFQVDFVLSSITQNKQIQFLKVISIGLKDIKCHRLRQYRPLGVTLYSIMQDDKQIVRQLTKEFTEAKSLIAEHNNLKNKIRKIDRKLKSIECKYKFLADIVSINGKDVVIEVASKKLLKEAGFKDVRLLTKVKPLREDLQIWCDDCIILVECKGSRFPILKDSELGQVKKYIDYRTAMIQSQIPVYGFVIINHDNLRSYTERNSNSVDLAKHNYALASRYGIVTTTDLVKGFVMLKKKSITFTQFKNQILQFGQIKFGVGMNET